MGVAADRSGPRYPFQVLSADRSASGLSTSIANANPGLQINMYRKIKFPAQSAKKLRPKAGKTMVALSVGRA